MAEVASATPWVLLEQELSFEDQAAEGWGEMD